MYIKFGNVKSEWRNNYYQSVDERAVENAILKLNAVHDRIALVFDDKCEPSRFRYVDLDKFISFWIEPELEYFKIKKEVL